MRTWFTDLLGKLLQISHLVVVVCWAEQHLEDKFGPDDAVDWFLGLSSDCADCKYLLSLFHGLATVACCHVGIYKLNLAEISTSSSICHRDA